MDRKTLFEKWCKKLIQTPEELEKEYQEIAKGFVPTDFKDEEELQTHAKGILKARLSRQLASNAKPYEGVTLGFADKIDWARNPRLEAETVFKEDPERAVQEGWTDEEGAPLYRDFEWRKGQPMAEHDWGRTVHLIAKEKDSESNPIYRTLGLKGDSVDQEIPRCKKVLFRANTGKDGKRLFGTGITKLQAEGDTLDFEAIKEYLPADALCEFKDLKTMADKASDDRSVIVAIRGIVSRIFLSQAGEISSNITITSPDIGLDDFDNDSGNVGVTCWLPRDYDIDFGEESVVWVIGSPRLNRDGNPILNTIGVWPERIVAPENPPQPVEAGKGDSW